MEKKLTKNEKISRAMKGRTLSDEHKLKLSKAKKGIKRSNETKAKIKQTLLGDKIKDLKKDHPEIPKTNMSRTHLTAADVKQIRDRYSNEEALSIRQLAKEYNVSRHTIHSVVTYKLWR
ncbi:NUMOD3 domain-containing DNA-binding protein [Lederbergia lenta]|uniref:NUMOD3 motif (2 copies) n=1 Tax=Lederbergia lenta TaxID=1467 RepID=A0A2X4X0F4_LEDLE|nr:NUMOD3 domain-containing DNA-binding protein [Lederbergia lenta]MCM3112940.1 NUMOD3 domain-containing DNA-binding protein [Lederbergia lenta]MEC2326093.1 helix-turn-helix domain-containing protein [Lederbergia lenta]SQI63420.1 NUMOD3 motif (2 copies) [Lederbergia lenta]